MKVMIIASLAYSLTNFRERLLADLVGQRHDVVACAPDDDPDVIARLTALGVRFQRIAMDRAGINPWRDLRTFFNLRHLLRTERPDMLLAYTQKPIIYGGLAARFSRTPVHFFAMVSGLGHAFTAGAGLRRAALRACVVRLYRHALARARCTFVFNPDDLAEMRRRGMLTAEQRVVQVPGSGIDLDLFAQRPCPPGAPVFLLVSRIMREKGLLEFIAAATALRWRFPEARFQILGMLDANPSGIGREQFDQYLAGSGVEYLGAARDVRPYLEHAHVFVLPTYYREGLPRSILEAMAVGRAIVTTDAPGCRETVVQGSNGFLVAPRDAAALTAALAHFARDPSLAATMGARSRQLAEVRFNVRIVNRLLLDAMFADLPPDTHGPPGGALGDARGVETIMTLVAAILLLPVILAVAAVVLLTLGRPLLFSQCRSGRNGSLFRLVKFRTMRIQYAPDGSALPDGARTTKAGRLLRRLRLDELPELWNIVRGDMALVGPRPLLPETIAAMGPAGSRRGAVRPGLTGWAQINGNVRLSGRERLALDLWYVANRTVTLDLRILWRTLRVVIGGEHVNLVAIRRANAGAADRGG